MVLALDAGNVKSYNATGTVYSTGWSGSVVNPSNSFDGNLSTATGLPGGNSTATYTFAGGLSVSGTVRIYVSFGASSSQVSGLPNVIVVDGTDVSSKMAAANLYTDGVGAGWIDVTSEVGSTFDTIVLTGTFARANPIIYAIEVNGQILIDFINPTTWTDLSGRGNNGTLTNGPTYSSANGGSIVFDGGDDYISIGSQSLVGSGNTPFSVELWFYNTKTLTSGQETIPIRVKQDTEFFVSLKNVSGTFNIYAVFRGQTQWGIPLTQSDYVNKWICLTIVYNGGGKSTASSYDIYSNAVKLPYGTNNLGGAGGVPNCNLLGADGSSGCNATAGFYQGNISAYKVYNRALSAAEVSQNFNALRGRFGI